MEAVNHNKQMVRMYYFKMNKGYVTDMTGITDAKILQLQCRWMWRRLTHDERNEWRVRHMDDMVKEADKALGEEIEKGIRNLCQPQPKLLLPWKPTLLLPWKPLDDVIMSGLLLRQPNANNIVNNGKRWEVRSRATKKRGRIAIVEIRKDAWVIVGYATLTVCFPLTADVADKHEKLHQAPNVVSNYKTPHAWVLKDVREANPPITMIKQKGCVVWVNLLT